MRLRPSELFLKAFGALADYGMFAPFSDRVEGEAEIAVKNR